MLTKKNVLLISGVVSVFLVSIDRIGTYQLCGGYPGSCVDTLFNSSMLLFVFPFVFLFSLITYFLPEAVFRAWARFTTWWIPLQIVLVFLTPESFPGAFISIIDRQVVAIILSGLFAIISLLIVLISWFRSRAT